LAEESRQNRNNDKNRADGQVSPRVSTVRFPVYERKYVCPVCDGNKCRVCKWTGEYYSEEEWVDVQEHLVVQYLHDNLNHVSMLYNHMYGNMINVKRLGTVKEDWAGLEISVGQGQFWITYNLEGLPPKFFYNKGEYNKWLA